MGRKANVLGREQLKKKVISNIIESTVKFDCKVRGVEETTKDTLRVNYLIKALIDISEESFKSRGSISNKLLDAIFDGNVQVVSRVKTTLTGMSGFVCYNLQDIIYYLTWFATTDVEPTYPTFEEFANNRSE